MLYKPKFLSPSATGDTKYLEKIEDDRDLCIHLLGGWNAYEENPIVVNTSSLTTGHYVIVTTAADSEHSYKPASISDGSLGSTVDNDNTAEVGDVYYYNYNDGWNYIAKSDIPSYEFSCVCDGNTKVTGGELTVMSENSVFDLTASINISNYLRNQQPSATDFTLFQVYSSQYNYLFSEELFIQPSDSETKLIFNSSSSRVYFDGYNNSEAPFYNYTIDFLYSGVETNYSTWRITPLAAIPMDADIKIVWASETNNNTTKYYISSIVLSNIKSKQKYICDHDRTAHPYFSMSGLILHIQQSSTVISLGDEYKIYPVNHKGEYNKFVWNIPVSDYNAKYDDTEAQWQVTLTDGAQTVQSGIEVARTVPHPQLEIEVID